MMVWAFLSRMQDVLAGVGLVTVLYWTVKLTLKAAQYWRR